MIKSPTPASLYKLKHLFNLLGLRIVPAYFYEANKELFQQWHFNACNQTALVTGYVLRRLLESPGYCGSNPFTSSTFSIELYEGIFTEEHMPTQYNHAYVYAREIVDQHDHSLTLQQGYCFFIDVARISNPTVFQTGLGLSSLPVAYSQNYQIVSVKQLDMLKMLVEFPEYYTKKSGFQICLEIEKTLRKLGFDLDNFNWNM